MIKSYLGSFLALSLLAAPSAAVQANSPPESSPHFTVKHTPNPATATAKTDTVKGQTTYFWNFRTDVHNGFDVPIRIIEFGAVNFWNDQWQPRTEPSFNAAQFGEWYTAADSAPGGWIQPGETAADANNWNRSTFPVSARSRWFYIAEDEAGQRYVSRQEIHLAPFVPEAAPWSDELPGTLIPLTIRWEPSGRELPPGSQIRISRLARYPYPQYAVYEITPEHNSQPMIRVPGMYRLQVHVPGHRMTTLPVVLAKDDSGLDLVMRVIPNDQTAAPDEMPFSYDARHAYLEDIRQIKLRTDRENTAFVEAYQKYSATHDDAKEFTYEEFAYDLGPFVAYLTKHMATTSPLPVRRYAAYVLPPFFPELAAEQARIIDQLLPADSVLLAADPQAAARAAARLDKLLDGRRRINLAQHHPDRYVRGHATAGWAHMAAKEGEEETLARCYEALVTEFSDMKELDYDRKKLDPANKIRVGGNLPQFSAPLLTGEGQITQETAAGKYRLLHFWASWCGPCKAEMKHVHEMYEKLHPLGLEILSFSLDRKAEDARNYQMKKWHMPWANAFLAEGTESPTGKALEVVGIPRLVLVDPQGRILAVDGELRGAAMTETIAGHLAP